MAELITPAQISLDEKTFPSLQRLLLNNAVAEAHTAMNDTHSLLSY